MARTLFDSAAFVGAARDIAANLGPGAVTVDAVIAHAQAPKGSFYHRFASRDALLGQLWLQTVLAYEAGFVAAIEAGDGLGAALHTPSWARTHLDDARVLLLHGRHDFVQGEWPGSLQQGVTEQTLRMEGCLKTFARQYFGGTRAPDLRRAQFVLLEVPVAAVKSHLQKGERPPALVDDLITRTFNAIVHGP
jgi:AcrR family transcriptional regulator